MNFQEKHKEYNKMKLFSSTKQIKARSNPKLDAKLSKILEDTSRSYDSLAVSIVTVTSDIDIRVSIVGSARKGPVFPGFDGGYREVKTISLAAGNKIIGAVPKYNVNSDDYYMRIYLYLPKADKWCYISIHNLDSYKKFVSNSDFNSTPSSKFFDENKIKLASKQTKANKVLQVIEVAKNGSADVGPKSEAVATVQDFINALSKLKDKSPAAFCEGKGFDFVYPDKIFLEEVEIEEGIKENQIVIKLK